MVPEYVWLIHWGHGFEFCIGYRLKQSWVLENRTSITHEGLNVSLPVQKD